MANKERGIIIVGSGRGSAGKTGSIIELAKALAEDTNKRIVVAKEQIDPFTPEPTMVLRARPQLIDDKININLPSKGSKYHK